MSVMIGADDCNALNFENLALQLDASVRVHLVCPANGGCTAFALTLCELLDAGCASDFSCLLAPSDLPRLYKTLGARASGSGSSMVHGRRAERRAWPSSMDARAAWTQRDGGAAALLVKNTISAQTPGLLEPLPNSLAQRGSAAFATSAGLFTHQLLLLRDPVQQYLSLRAKPWCHNCGGFADKLAAQDELVRRCLGLIHGQLRPERRRRRRRLSASRRGGGETRCPFDAVIFERDVFGTGAASLLSRLGLRLPRNGSRLLLASGDRLTGVRVRRTARRARNAALRLPPDLVDFGNMRGTSLRASRAAKRSTWSCAVARRVRALVPTLYDLYHPNHCAGGELSDGALAEADLAVDEATGRRNATRRKHLRNGQLGPAQHETTICDAFVGRDVPDCNALPVLYRVVCETIVRAHEAAMAREAARPGPRLNFTRLD